MNSTLKILSDLVSFKSVTPIGIDCLEYIKNFLDKLGFESEIIKFGNVYNLYSKKDSEGPHICFAGHVDVVPPGDKWDSDPFKLNIHDGKIYGLGVVDMKGSIACFLNVLKNRIKDINSSVSVLLTTDEEGLAVDGLAKCVSWLKERNQVFDLFLLGEPSCIENTGDSIKSGRRGSLTSQVRVLGNKGHIAYPEHACSITSAALEIMEFSNNKSIGYEYEDFPKSVVQVTHFRTPERVENLLPGECFIDFGIRFNPSLTPNSIIEMFENKFLEISNKYKLEIISQWTKHGNPFFVRDKNIKDFIRESVINELGISPRFNADGATSDGRFLIELAPVIEIGLEESQAHKTNEHTTLENIMNLERVFDSIVSNFHKINT
ncbi:succinyl-diaminopimelate desuccinylase [Candidatus Nesciobacter abundans]|uniref:Succinyl-diaminopimelate desuccinylase n=1 Tax=Candidatus Nesciobacter abundans TaxID=2601668 RepID=A0A5C0UHL4_9PROT|nr:succinyl-diaminopimelate desuccinylase [Candidatus Nesciobacter abundans]QEK39053.1 succinyl-diaminopimelate desuccinylase [Candidatus Nesciobacter abundans]